MKRSNDWGKYESNAKVIKNKISLLKCAETLGNVSRACKAMGYSRGSFYKFKKLYETGGEQALLDMSRRKPCPKNRIEQHLEDAVSALAEGGILSRFEPFLAIYPFPGC